MEGIYGPGISVEQVYNMLVSYSPPSPPNTTVNVPEVLQPLLARMLAIRAADRPSAREVAEELQQLLGQLEATYAVAPGVWVSATGWGSSGAEGERSTLSGFDPPAAKRQRVMFDADSESELFSVGPSTTLSDPRPVLAVAVAPCDASLVAISRDSQAEVT